MAAIGLSLSGFFWIFGRLGLGLLVVFAFLLLWSKRTELSRTGMSLLATLAAIASLQSWMAAAAVGALLLVGLFQKDSARAALIGLVGLVFGASVTVWWIAGSTGLASIVDHLDSREAAIDYTLVDWFRRQLGFFLRFESWLVAGVMIAGTAYALVRRQLLMVLLPILWLTLLFSLAFRQNAWIHEYWNWIVSFILAIAIAGFAQLFQSKIAMLSTTGALAIALTIVSLVVSINFGRLNGSNYETQFVGSSAAGELVSRTVYPDGQRLAWYIGSIPTPRWLAWYTQRTPRSLSRDHAKEARDEELVLVRRHFADGIDAEPLARNGEFEFFTVRQLREWLVAEE